MRDLFFNFNPDILICMETIANSNRALKIIEKLSVPNFLEIPPVGFSGGIWLLWKNKADFKFLSYELMINSFIAILGILERTLHA